MKKFFVLLLTLVIFFPSALADTITVDLDNATPEELQAARDAIDARLAEIRSASAPIVDDDYIIRGSGIEILTNVEVKASLSRFNVHYTDEASVSCFNGDNELYIHDYIEHPQTIPMMIVESQEDWYIDISPIETMDSPYISGIGSYTSDLFVVTPPSIVSITLRDIAGYFNYTDVNLYYVDKTGSVHIEDWVIQSDLAPEQIDYIIKPNSDAVAWFWVIRCSDNVEWSITAK